MIPNSEFLTGKIYWTKGFEAGQASEQERIVKILEAEVARHKKLGLKASAFYLEQTIAQIKGEQK